MSEYDDDRPGMMRIHIAQQRANELESFYTRDDLRSIAKARHVSYAGMTKRDLAIALAFAGVRVPIGGAA